jgi:hypothetical protein
MLRSFDLFRLDPHGSPMWVGTANDMESARRLILKNAKAERTRFLLWEQENQTKSIYEATKDEILLVSEKVDA